MNKPMLIGVSGLAGSGKDTVANHLCANYNFVKISFADTLKDAVAMIFDLPRELLEGDTEESREWRENHVTSSGKTPREILQLFGTEVGRSIDGDVWVRATRRRANELMQKGVSVVIPDMRFPNEQDMCNEIGFTLRVERGSVTPLWLNNLRGGVFYTDEETALNAYMTTTDVHPSEWMMSMPSAMGKMSHMIFNDDSLEDLHRYVDETLQTFEMSRVPKVSETDGNIP